MLLYTNCTNNTGQAMRRAIHAITATRRLKEQHLKTLAGIDLSKITGYFLHDYTILKIQSPTTDVATLDKNAILGQGPESRSLE